MPDETLVQEKKTTEVVGTDTATSTAPSLADMFDRMEQGKQEGRAVEEVIAEKKFETKKEEVKPEVKEEAKTEEVKSEEKTEEKVEEEDNLRAALKRTDAKKAEEQAKKDLKKEEKKEEEVVVPDEELKPLPTDKPKTVQRIKALLGKIQKVEAQEASTKKELAEKATKLAELEKKLGEVQSVDPKTNEAIKKQQDELAMYRRRYELDNDPEVKTKYDERVTSAESLILDTLKRRGAGDGLLKTIADEGGWEKFANSGKLITIPDGDGDVKQVTAAALADVILNQLPLGDRELIKSAMIEQVQTRRDRERFLKEEQGKATEYFKKKEEESKKAQEVEQQRIKDSIAVIDKWKQDIQNQDWMKDKVAPENATPAEKASVEEHNKYNKQLKSMLAKAIETKDLNGMLEVIEDSVRYYDERRTTAWLKRENERLAAELKAKNDEIVKFKTGGRSVPKSGSIATAPAQQIKPSTPQTLEDAFSMLERGEKILVNSAGEEE